MKYCLVFQLILFVLSTNVCDGYPLCQAYRHNAILVKTVDQPGMVFISRSSGHMQGEAGHDKGQGIEEEISGDSGWADLI